MSLLKNKFLSLLPMYDLTTYKLSRTSTTITGAKTANCTMSTTYYATLPIS